MCRNVQKTYGYSKSKFKVQVYIFLTKIIVESVVQKVRNLTYKENKMKKQERKKKKIKQKQKTPN